VGDEAALMEFLILVHPGSACGSANFNLGRSEARAARDRLIGRAIGASGLVSGGDSGSDSEMFYGWAIAFQRVSYLRRANGETPGDTYFEDLEDFALKKAHEVGFSNIEKSKQIDIHRP